MVNQVLSAVVALVFIATLASGCRKPAAAAAQDQDSGAKPAAAAEPPKPVPQTLPDVIARVNGTPVTKADLEKLISQIEMNAGGPVPTERRDEIYRGAIDRLVDLEVLAQEVKSRGIKGDEQRVESQLQSIRGQFKTEDEFKQALGARGMSAERLRDEMLKETQINAMMEAETAGTPPATDADVKEFYDKNPDEFKEPEQVRASHILIRTGEDDAAKKKAQATAASVLKQARSGTDFAQLAREHSSDGSAAQGGDLGFFVKERMVPEFSNAAFALQPGEISDIVESQFGLHIIKVTERKTADVVPLEKVSEQVKQYLTQKRRQERAEAFVKQLRGKAKIEVLI